LRSPGSIIACPLICVRLKRRGWSPDSILKRFENWDSQEASAIGLPDHDMGSAMLLLIREKLGLSIQHLPHFPGRDSMTPCLIFVCVINLQVEYP
jgi:hypothetical protein